ncbi:unnamed protein product [Microthlaspi erraticum]|uniref:Retrotransposon Copia-like N-terminal domain-containing protein n=1 Tax=Microthlaspi erraticum TaxID=1685480 RepID=A0A6D2IVV8_9BRAS|nr:unnamed protein product [Microthlaspi erraticum]
MLNVSNFLTWKEHLLLMLALMDLDLSLVKDPPSSREEFERWDRSNRVSMMIIRFKIPQEFRGIVPEDVTTAKELLAGLDKFFAKNEEAERSMLQAEYYSIQYRENESVRELIMRMKTVEAKLKRAGTDHSLLLDDETIAHFALKLLPLRYVRLQNVYRRLEEKFANENGRWPLTEIWSTSELISRFDMEEENLRREIADEVKREKRRREQ